MNISLPYAIHAVLDRLCRRPVLTAMAVISLIYGVTASIAGLALWRTSSDCVVAKSSAQPNIAQVAMDVADRDDPRVGGKSAPVGAEVSVACPCTAPNEWHWQRI